MDIAAFRDSFPQFSAELVPDARVQFHLTVAGKLLPAKRWDDLLDQGLGLYVAHQLTLELEVRKAQGGTGGIDAAAGPVTAETKTVGSMSHAVTRAGASGQGSALVNAGQYNNTIYGQQLWQLMQIVGAGGLVA